MSKESIKGTIDANIKQNGQGLITGIVMNSVLKDMVDDEYSELGDLAIELTSFGKLVASLFEDAVFTRDRSADVARLKAMFITSRAICGECNCGEVLCGQI